ncbi:MAG: hypothetical protein ACOYH4_03050 [Saccharofermentanales bacterium]|jgi:hypothetical protein
MKKHTWKTHTCGVHLAVIMAVLLVLGSLVGCQPAQATVEPTDATDPVQTDIKATEAPMTEPPQPSTTKIEKPEPKEVTFKLNCAVHNVLPDHVMDDKTPVYAYATGYQSPPFLLYFGVDEAHRLEAGKSYEIFFKPVSLLPEDLEMVERLKDAMPASVSVIQRLFDLKIDTFTEGKILGMDEEMFTYTVSD